MPWIRLSVGVPGPDAAAIGDALAALGAVAVTWLDAGDSAILEPAPGALPDLPAWRQARAIGLFALDTDLRALRERFAGRPVAVDFVADADWVGRWRRHVEPRRFGALTVAPSHAPDADLEGTVLRLDPGGAFGTGGHPTTRLCLAWLASMPMAGRSVLDYGCGSGILAIAAKLLGATRVAAVDRDPQALAVTRHNAARNGAARNGAARNGAARNGAARNGVTLEVASSDAFWARTRAGSSAGSEARRGFDLVVANILAGTLITEAARLRSSMTAGGRIALCGLLPEQVGAVVEAYPDVAFDAPRGMAGWTLLTGRRASPPAQ